MIILLTFVTVFSQVLAAVTAVFYRSIVTEFSGVLPVERLVIQRHLPVERLVIQLYLVRNPSGEQRSEA